MVFRDEKIPLIKLLASEPENIGNILVIFKNIEKLC